MKRHFSIFVVTLALALLPGSVAASSVDCEVMTIRASSSGKGLDPALRRFASVLGKKPFSSFDTFELIDKRDYDLKLDKPAVLQLSVGLSGSLTYRGAHKDMLSLRLELRPVGKAPVRIDGFASPGAPLFAAGFQQPDGTIVFAVICRGPALQLVQ